MKAYKGFDKDMRCKDFQYKEGEKYVASGEIECCKNGFHACENPLDVLHYYSAAKGSKYHIVECDKDISYEEPKKDTKFACREITIGAELSFNELIHAGTNAVFERIKKVEPTECTRGDYSTAATQGDYSTAATQGDYSTAATQGDCSIAATQGYCSTAATRGDCSTAATQGTYSTVATQGDCSIAATQGYCSTAATQGDYSTAATQGNYSTAKTNGRNSIALANGYKAKAQGAVGCFLVLTEFDDDYELIDCRCRRVDGEIIKENTLYTLQNGEFVEVEDVQP